MSGDTGSDWFWRIPGDCWEEENQLDLVGISEEQARFHSCVYQKIPNEGKLRYSERWLRPQSCIRCALWLKAYKVTYECQPRNYFCYLGDGALLVRDGPHGYYYPGPTDRLDIFLDRKSIPAAEEGQNSDIIGAEWSPVYDYGLGVRVSPSTFTGSDQALAFIRAQIRACSMGHTMCDTKDHRLPTRVVDLRDSRKIRVFESKNVSGKYAALSYCWGQDGNLKTTSKNYDAHASRIEWETLPRTFQDAIDLCRKINIDFIWIDSLCIIQDSRHDWEVESAKMGDVYANAFITIAASASRNPSEGCYYKTRGDNEEVAVIKDKSGSLVKIYARTQWNHPDDSLDYGRDFRPQPEISPGLREALPLHTRAWAFQERLLAARLIQFTRREIVWHCREAHLCECTDDLNEYHRQQNKGLYARSLFNEHLKRSFNNHAAAKSTWEAIVKSYAELELTNENDRLPALSGLAAKIGKNEILGRYYAGLWEDDFLSWLCWSFNYPTRQVDSSNLPSWSWFNLPQRPRFYFLNRETPYDITEYSVHCKTVGKNPYGRLHEGTVLIRGRLFKAIVGDFILENVRYGHNALFLASSVRPCNWDVDPEKTREGVPNTVHCLRIVAGVCSFYLLLHCLDEQNGIYQRKGCVQPISSLRSELTDPRLEKLFRARLPIDRPEELAYYTEGVVKNIKII